MTIHKRACLVGAGSSGIAVVKALADAGVSFDCFEKSDRVGGNWVFGNKNGMSSAYEGLYINTSRQRMQYADYPMPASYPDFPHHAQIAAYFEAYLDHFGLRRAVTFETSVERVVKDGDGWRVTVSGPSGTEERTYDAVLVANGHHWDPAWPEPRFPGTFDGLEMHAHDYKTKDQLRGKRVVVVGMGNSAMDIAVESSEVAHATFLAARRGVHVVPKYVLGRPLDQFITSARIPFAVRQRVAEVALKLAVGDVTRYGLPAPDHRLLEAHPTISGRILDRLGHGAITPKPNVRELAGERVVFADGSSEVVDVVVYCTGYKVTFPFFDPAFVSAPGNDLPLFKRVFHPEHHGLLFIGLLQPLGAIMPLAEAQGRAAAKYLTGRYALPGRAEMQADIETERARLRARYVRSRRHTMQVDFDDYLLDLAKEIARGEKRVRTGGGTRFVRGAAATRDEAAGRSVRPRES